MADGIDIDVVSKDIARLASSVRRLGADRTIVNNMAKRVRASVPPIRQAVRDNALRILPKRGGLNRWVARVSVNARVRRSASNAGVSLAIGRNSAKQRTDSAKIDAGRLRAPLFGDRRYWHLQAVRPGFASKAVTEEGVTEFRKQVVLAVDDAVEEALRG